MQSLAILNSTQQSFGRELTMAMTATFDNKFLGLRIKIWLLVLAILIVWGVSLLWFNAIEKAYYERDLGATDEVRKNPYYVAAKYLNSLGVTAKTLKNYQLLDSLPNGGTIFIESSRVGLSQSRYELLDDWVKQGGHLVLVATEEYDQEFNESRDKFFDELKLRVYPKVGLDKFKATKNQYVFNGYEKPTEANFYSEFYLQDASGNATFTDEKNKYAQLIQYDYGKGMITAIASIKLFSNYQMDDLDHAMLLAQIIGKSTQAYFVYNQNQPGLIDLLVENAAELVLTFVVLLIILILSQSVRRGPKLKDEQPVQREIRQHLEAAAEFNFRVDSGVAASERILGYLEQLMRPHITGYARLTVEEQIQKVAHQLNLKPKELAILWRTDAIDTDSLVQKAKLLQLIRKQL